MNADNIILLGLNDTVTAISKNDGSILWEAELPGSLNGDDFVSLACDGEKVFAHTEGKLHCLDLANGLVLWSNQLKGYGYGLATLCCPGQGPVPDPAAIQDRRKATTSEQR